LDAVSLSYLLQMENIINTLYRSTCNYNDRGPVTTTTTTSTTSVQGSERDLMTVTASGRRSGEYLRDGEAEGKREIGSCTRPARACLSARGADV